MSALLPVLLCGGGCLAVCWLMMSRSRRQSDGGDGGGSAPGSPPDGEASGRDA